LELQSQELGLIAKPAHLATPQYTCTVLKMGGDEGFYFYFYDFDR
jgi:hypothetical protein